MADQFLSRASNNLLNRPTIRYLPLIICIKQAPAANSDASVTSKNGFEGSTNDINGADLSRRLILFSAASASSVHSNSPPRPQAIIGSIWLLKLVHRTFSYIRVAINCLSHTNVPCSLASSVISRGGRICSTPSRVYFSSIPIPSLLIRLPRKVTVLRRNSHFVLFSLIPDAIHASRSFATAFR